MREVAAEVARQRQRDRGLALALGTIVDEPQRQVGLVDVTGLADARVVEAHEVGLLGLVRAQEVLVGLQEPVQSFREIREIAFGVEPLHAVVGRARVEQRRDGAHAAPPAPNTSTSANRQAGDAWPTRITCDGSPLPQNGVPITSSVRSSPTAFRLRQNVAETPR